MNYFIQLFYPKKPLTNVHFCPAFSAVTRLAQYPGSDSGWIAS
jgi:hypothetical protein